MRGTHCQEIWGFCCAHLVVLPPSPPKILSMASRLSSPFSVIPRCMSFSCASDQLVKTQTAVLYWPQAEGVLLTVYSRWWEARLARQSQCSCVTMFVLLHGAIQGDDIASGQCIPLARAMCIAAAPPLSQTPPLQACAPPSSPDQTSSACFTL